MKKMIGMIVVLLVVSGSAGAANIILEFKVQYFSPVEEAFKDIYGGGVMYGGEVSIGVWQGLELWFGGSYFSREGELTFTKEKTELKMMPLGGGLRYRWQGKNLSPYLAAGLNYYQYKESNAIGEVDEREWGVMTALGTYVRVTGGLLIDLFANYSYAKLNSSDFDTHIGGFGAGIGIAYEF